MTQRVPEAIRQQVRERAGRRCEYCRKPEGFGLYRYHVDHIIPLLHGGGSGLNDLAWTCFQCNTNKGVNVASYDPETRLLTPLYNPRMDKWTEHFTMEGALIKGITPIGRVTVQILQINAIEQLEIRQQLITSKRW